MVVEAVELELHDGLVAQVEVLPLVLSWTEPYQPIRVVERQDTLSSQVAAVEVVVHL